MEGVEDWTYGEGASGVKPSSAGQPDWRMAEPMDKLEIVDSWWCMGGGGGADDDDFVLVVMVMVEKVV